jgi:stage V sporulation protein D (sporulation-specific penicillin-binding protein)
MKGVVQNGTGSKAYVEGYAIAGKTSTSTDDNGDHTISFCGIAPADSPEIVALVVLNKPKDKSMMSSNSAKTCGLIISRTLEYLGVAREYSDQDVSRLNSKVYVPDLTGKTLAEARKTLGALGLRVEAGDLAMGDQTIVRSQSPAAGSQLHNKGLVFLYPDKTKPKDLVAIPDFTNKTVNECLSSAAESGLNILIEGDCLGVAVSQNPKPTFSTSTSNKGTDSTEAGSTEAGSTTQATGSGSGAGTSATTAKRLARGSIVRVKFAAVEEIQETVDESAANQ